MGPWRVFHWTLDVGRTELNSIEGTVIILSSTVKSGMLDTIVIVKLSNIVLGRMSIVKRLENIYQQRSSATTSNRGALPSAVRLKYETSNKGYSGTRQAFFDTKFSSDRLKISTDSASGAVEWEFVDKSTLTEHALVGDRRY